MDGKKLFYRYALSCIRDAVLQGRITAAERDTLLAEKADENLLKKAFPDAWPGVKAGKRKPTRESVRNYFWFEHNRNVCRKNLACMSWPAQVKKRKSGGWIIELKPICKLMWAKTELDLKEGDWIIIHRQVIAEKISQKDAEKVAKFIQELEI